MDKTVWCGASGSRYIHNNDLNTLSPNLNWVGMTGGLKIQ